MRLGILLPYPYVIRHSHVQSHHSHGGSVSKAHPGFEGAAHDIAMKERVSMDSARAILAKSSRNASAKAKKANPRLKRVKG